MLISDLDEVRALSFRLRALEAMTSKTLPSLTIRIGGNSDLILGLGDEEFLSDLGDLLHEQLAKTRNKLEELGVEFPDTVK